MTLGIVGAEAAKFTPETEQRARAMIRFLFHPDVTEIVSGGCHLGGIDVWAIEEADRRDLATRIFLPKSYNWSNGYKLRNIQIAEASDHVVCLVVRELPSTYQGMRFPLCYHCGTTDHVKSGGCWTVKYAKKLGKTGDVIVVQ